MHKDAHITVGYDNKNMTQKHFSKLSKLLKNFFSFYLKQTKKKRHTEVSHLQLTSQRPVNRQN